MNLSESPFTVVMLLVGLAVAVWSIITQGSIFLGIVLAIVAMIVVRIVLEPVADWYYKPKSHE